MIISKGENVPITLNQCLLRKIPENQNKRLQPVKISVVDHYYNFCLPHASLRQPLPQSVPTNGSGSAKIWQSRTPAMAAGLTDHVWSLRAVLLFRVPPWSQP